MGESKTVGRLKIGLHVFQGPMAGNRQYLRRGVSGFCQTTASGLSQIMG